MGSKGPQTLTHTNMDKGAGQRQVQLDPGLDEGVLKTPQIPRFTGRTQGNYCQLYSCLPFIQVKDTD